MPCSHAICLPTQGGRCIADTVTTVRELLARLTRDSLDLGLYSTPAPDASTPDAASQRPADGMAGHPAPHAHPQPGRHAHRCGKPGCYWPTGDQCINLEPCDRPAGHGGACHWPVPADLPPDMPPPTQD